MQRHSGHLFPELIPAGEKEAAGEEVLGIFFFFLPEPGNPRVIVRCGFPHPGLSDLMVPKKVRLPGRSRVAGVPRSAVVWFYREDITGLPPFAPTPDSFHKGLLRFTV